MSVVLSQIRLSLVSLYSPEYPSVGETHALSVLSGVATYYFADRLENLSIFDMVSISCADSAILTRFLRTSVPNILGISVGYGTYSFLQKEYVHIRNAVGDGCWIVLGGPIPTKISNFILQQFPDVYIVIGEGEIAFKELLSQRLQMTYPDLSKIPGVAFVKDGDITTNNRTLVNLKNSPPTYRSHIDAIRIGGGQIYCELSRGCSWARCKFCLRGLTDCNGTRDEHRRYSINRLKTEFLNLSLLGIKNITFADEDFLGVELQQSIYVVEAIAAAQNNLPTGIKFDVSILPSSIFAKNMSPAEVHQRKSILTRLTQLGLRKVFLGVESGSESQLKRYGKAHSSIEASQAISILKGLDITFELGWIMFDPLCTLEELNSNLQFIENNMIVPYISFLFSELRLQPGTGYITTLNKIEKKYNIELYDKSLCPDTLSYKYAYLHSGVSKIITEVNYWRGIVQPLHYPLKNLSRFGEGSILGKNIAAALDILFDIRMGLFCGFKELMTSCSGVSSEQFGARYMVFSHVCRASLKIIDLINKLDNHIAQQPVLVNLFRNAKAITNKLTKTYKY